MSIACNYEAKKSCGDPPEQEGRHISKRDDEIAEFLTGAGIERRVTSAALEIDAVIQRWRRRFHRRDLGVSALRALNLDSDLDLAQLDVLFAIRGPVNEFGEDASKEETMISTVAERLRIDPSRASRLVSDMIGRGFAQRAVSQCDARRTIVELTEKGDAVVDAVRNFKFLVMGQFLSGWTEDEIATFIPLMERFSAWTDEALEFGAERFPEEVAAIARKLAANYGD